MKFTGWMGSVGIPVLLAQGVKQAAGGSRMVGTAGTGLLNESAGTRDEGGD